MLELIISSCFVNFFMMYLMSGLVDKKSITIKQYILPYILLTMSGVICYKYIEDTPIRIMVLTIVFFFYIKFMYKENNKKSIIISILFQIGLMISEVLFSIVAITILQLNIEELLLNPIYYVVINVIIVIIDVLIFKIPFIRRFINYFEKITIKISSKQLMFLSMALILIANLLTGILYYKVDFIYLLVFNTVVTIFCFIIIIYNFYTQNKYINVYDKYNTTLNSLKESEDIIDKYRVSSHENKNQLLTIRNMISDKNTDTAKYIDEIVKNKAKDDELVMKEVSKIPTGGLRGLIYSKLLLMKQNKIKYDLNISKEIKTVDLIKDLEESDMLDICQIVGVYIDNAIDAVNELEKKYIDIELYLDAKDLVFEVSNYYKGTIELDKLEEKGYTTKKSGHGYGLSLAKKIIDSNKKLQNEKKLSKEIFTQILKIKLK